MKDFRTMRRSIGSEIREIIKGDTISAKLYVFIKKTGRYVYKENHGYINFFKVA